MAGQKPGRVRRMGVYVAGVGIVLGGLLLWVYYAKSTQLAQNSLKPITTTAQAISSVKQVQADLNSINVNAQLDTSEIDSVLTNQ